MFVRKSAKRQKILDLFQTSHLLTAQQVHDRLPEIDQATIYRNINRFVEEGTLREVRLEKGISSYELNNSDHQHVICTDCKKVESIEVSKQIFTKEAAKKGFTIKNVDIAAEGLCEDCVEQIK